jgi:hypothetical protein
MLKVLNGEVRSIDYSPMEQTRVCPGLFGGEVAFAPYHLYTLRIDPLKSPA